jgi:hypothetical protein
MIHNGYRGIPGGKPVRAWRCPLLHSVPRLKKEPINTSTPTLGFRDLLCGKHYPLPVRSRGSLRNDVKFRRRAGGCWCVVDENRVVPSSAVTCTEFKTDRSASSRDKRRASSNDSASDES